MEAIKKLGGILEAILFVAGKPLKFKELVKILNQDEALVKQALELLREEKKDSGIVLLDSGNQYQLATNSAYSTQVKNFLNAELREKLTDATVEVLAIIAYRQPVSKAEIEAIRGVNSQYSIRALLIRGLIEKVANPADARSFLYQTTTEFLMHLGLNSNKELPEFEKLVENIKLPQTAALSNSAESLETPVKQPANTSTNRPQPTTPKNPPEATEPSEQEEEGGYGDEDDEE